MLIIRRSTQKDAPAILDVLTATDLLYPNYKRDSFWTAERDDKIVGVVRVEEHADFALIESLGVLPQYQKQGIASQLLKESTNAMAKDLYLYTLIPEYFTNLGFQPIDPPAFIPSRNRYDCKGCRPEQCVCMVRKTKHAA
ncbi:MAG: GNAT family N-acetyltransferase [Candidatus Margulisbacteria bacterium]|nr:GNAT family N-acetyltransferase [Candidatus Margulisiibacteriota bacterium]